MAEKAKESSTPAAKGPAVAPQQAGPQPTATGGMSSFSGALSWASLQVASGAAEPPPSFNFSTDGVLGMQRVVGNRAVANAMARFVQRVPVSANTSETLYNQKDDAAGQAGAAHYGGAKRFQMERDADTAVNVSVRIKFVHQARNTMPPRKGHPEDPRLGAKKGDPTELPTGDRAWATETADKAVAHWQGKLKLVGEDQPRPDAEKVTKRIPVVFKSVPVFDLASTDFDQTIAVHPPGVIGGSTGHPIDAGNYYMEKNKKAYPADDDMIYAHEYGHLIGIPDEYSQSNEQMNLLIHRAAGSDANSAMDALDKKTVERMVLAALSRPLYAQLQAVMPGIGAALRRRRGAIKQKMTVAAKAAARSDEVRDLLTERLTAMSTAKVQPRVPRAVALQTTTNFSQAGVSATGVESVFSAGAIATQIGDTYWEALQAPQGEKVAVPGLGDLKITVHESIFAAGAPARGSTALSKAAKGEAAGQIGAKRRPGLPFTPAPGTLAAQLLAEVAAWDGAGGSIESQITPDAFQAKMVATLTAATAAAVAPPPPGASAAPPAIKSQQQLMGKAWGLVNNAATEASKQLATALISSTLNPLLETNVGQLRVAIGTEVEKIMTMTPTELAANPSPDPNMAAVVADMKGRLDTAKTALAGTGMDPLGVTGGTTPAQDVTYSYQGMMGSNATTALRPDQFSVLVDNFNTQLKHATEQNFKAETS